MNILPEVVFNLSKEEIRNYKLFINRTHSERERKDEQLFDLIKKHYPDNYDEDYVYNKLYINGNKNAFYRLKNKLLDDVGLSLAHFHFGTTDVNLILKDIFLSRIFAAKNAWDVSRYYLAKAEKRAEEIESYELLDTIYTDFIKLSHELLDVNPKEYIEKRLKNKHYFDDLREVDDLLAIVIYNIRKSQTFSVNQADIKLLDKTIAKFKSKQHIKLQFKLKLYEAISKLLLSKNNYVDLEKYLIKTYADFEKQQLFSKNTHQVKLELLIYLANTSFKLKKYSTSLKYAELLKKSLHQYDNALHDKYIYYYINICINNYSETNPPKALELLTDALHIKAIKTHPIHVSFIYLNLVTLHFDLKNYKLALKYLIKLVQLDAFYHLDDSFQLKINITELIIRYELHDYEYIDTRTKSLLRINKSVLNSTNYDSGFIKLMQQLVKNSQQSQEVKQPLIHDFLKQYSKKITESHVAIINYRDWLETLLVDN